MVFLSNLRYVNRWRKGSGDAFIWQSPPIILMAEYFSSCLQIAFVAAAKYQTVQMCV